MTDWKNVVVPKVRDVLVNRRSRGIPKASIRGTFYNLVSLEMIPNTQDAYKSLSRALVVARKSGIIPSDWIVDETRKIVDIDDTYGSPGDIIDDWLKELDELADNYIEEYLPRWYGQPNYVEVRPHCSK